MKKILLKSISLVLAIMMIMSCAALAISAVSYVAGTNGASASYKAGKYYSQLSQIPLTGNQRQDVVAVAMSQLQYMESNSSSDLSGTAGGSSNYTEFCYNFGYDIGSNYAWCAAFVTWSLRQAGINKVGTGSAFMARNNSNYYWCEVSCGFWVSALKTQGYWQGSKGRYSGTYVPKSGDLIFFENGGDSWSDHIGIVVYCNGSTVYTVEGNTSGSTGVVANGGRVAFKSYPIGSTSILGYGAMPYNTSASSIDYSGLNPTPGLYIADGNKYLYTSSSATGSHITLPKGTLLEVTGIQQKQSSLSDSFILKCKYNGNTYYVSNNTDRIVQITQSSGSTSGGSTGGTTDTSGTLYMGSNIDYVGTSSSSYTATNGAASANQSIINVWDFGSAETTTLYLQGWCCIQGGQNSTIKWTADGGTTWNDLTINQITDRTDVASTAQALSGSTSWTPSATSAGLKITINLSAYAGKTINVTVARAAASTGNLMSFATVKNIKVPGGSSSGSGSTSGFTSTTAYQQKACIDYINGDLFTSDNEATRFNPVSMACGTQTGDGNLNVSGWCMVNGGQKGICYSVDGGTTWIECTNASYSDGTNDHKTVAVAGGLTEAYANTTNALFNVNVNLSDYMGQTIDVMFGRIVAANTTLVTHFLTVTGVAVGAGTTSGAATINGTISHSNTTTSCPFAYHGCVDTINGLGSTNFNSAGLNPYRKTSEASSANHIATATGVTVDSSRTITVAGWLIMRGGIQKYVYSIDGSNWYPCGGTRGTASEAIMTHVSNSGYLGTVDSSWSANGSFQNASALTLDLSGCAGHTVDVYVGVVPAFSGYTDRVTQFLTIKSVAVPAYESAAPAPDTTVHTTAAVVNFVNKVGPDGTTETNYANDLIAWKGTYPSIPIANALTGTNTSLTIDGWCIINGGQQNTIKWSVDGGKTWAGTCSVASWSNGSDDHANAAAVWCNMNSISTTGANFSDATADLSAYKGQTISVTFGRMGANGTMYPFLTISEVTVPGCAHSSTSTQTTAATCTAAGSSKVVCNSCGETISTTTIPATGHKAGAAATCTTAQTCTVCGTQLAAASGHSYTSKDTSSTYLKSEATCTSAAVYYYKCANCSAKGTDTYTSGSALAHSYTEKDTSSTYRKSEATCISAAVYYYKCATCTAKGTDTYTSGSTTAHTYSNTYSSDANSHWYECTYCHGTTGAGAHTYENGSCSVCGYGCSHVGGSEATCTTAQICTLCGATLEKALGHSYPDTYQHNDEKHWKVCTRCNTASATTSHTYSNGVCICGFAEPVVLPNFNSSVDYINSVGPDGTSNSPYSGMSGNINSGAVSIPFPLSSKTNYVKLQGWALVEGGIIGYKWSVDGANWNDCTYASLSAAGDEHINASAGYGINSSNTTKDNAIFMGLCADISYYSNQTVNVTFAAVATDGTIVPFATVTNVKAGTPNNLGTSFDSFYVGSTEQVFGGYTGGTISGVTLSGINSSTGALTATNVSAGTSMTLWGWVGFDAPIASFGYYFDNYSSAVTNSTPVNAEDSVIAIAGQYAKRMKITVSTASLASGDHTVTFIVKFADGTVKELATWNISVVASTGAGGTIAGSNGQYANVIILSGQSNAYGASPTDHSTYNIQSKYGSTDFGNIYIHYNNINAAPDNSADGYTWKSLASNAGFEKYRVGIGGENSKRFGPELGIANYLKSAFPNETFYIIKFTAAGTNINGQWFPNDGNGADNWNLVSDMGNYLYPQMAAYINESIGMIQAMDSRPVKIHAYAWVQGESDAGTPAMAASYYAYEQLMLNSLRSDFAAYAADGGIAFVDYAISELTYPETFTSSGITYYAGQNVWAYSKALNDSKRANAQYLFDTVNSATENATYGIGKSILINKTDWMSKWDVGYDSDRWHLAPQSMEALGQAIGVAIHFMDGKSATHTHVEEIIAGTEATCTESGMTDGIRCSSCGVTLVEQKLIPAKGHAFDSDSDADCNNGCGYVRENICEHSYTANAWESDGINHWNVCSLCGENVNQTAHSFNHDCDVDCNICGYVRETSHVLVTIEGFAATCISEGLSDGQRCGVCGYISVAQTTIAKLSHSYKETVTAPTCTQRGYTTYTCQNGCGKSYVSDYVNKTGHTYTSEVVAPTCTDRGYTLYTCECGATYKNNYTSSAHSYKETVTAPSCSGRGYTTYTCTICQYSYKANYTENVGHSYKTTPVAATCTQRGYTLYECTDCSASHKGDFTAALGHSYTSEVKAPTCADNGYTLHSCDCGASYKSDFKAALGHSYTTVTTPATCTTGSYVTHTCSACEAVYVTDYVAPAGHNYVETTNEAAGTITHTCSGCGMSYVTKIPTVALTAPANKDTVVLANDGVYQWYNTFDHTTYCTSAYYHDQQNSDIYFPSHVTLEWEAVEGAYAYTISISTNKDMSDSANYTVTVTAGAIQNLYVNTTYYWQITALCEDGECADGGRKSEIYSFTTAMSPRTVAIDGVGNTRDIGGYETTDGFSIKQGMVYRGATLDGITAAGKNTMLSDLGIKTDLDLRKPGEGTAGTSSPIGVNYININGKYYVATDATGIHSAEGKAAIAEEIRVFADASNYPIYVHCSLGRDRTGTIVMIIQALLGADRNTLMMDYELSLFSSVATQDGAPLSAIKANMQTTLDYIENNFEGDTFQEKTENYVLSTGVTQEEINTIRALMLETA